MFTTLDEIRVDGPTDWLEYPQHIPKTRVGDGVRVRYNILGQITNSSYIYLDKVTYVGLKKPLKPYWVDSKGIEVKIKYWRYL